MRQALDGLTESIVIAQVSKTLMPMRVTNDQVFDAKLIVFASDSWHLQGVLSSSVHQAWAIKYGTTMRNDATYTPTALFEPFPRPSDSIDVASAIQELDEVRKDVMTARRVGLTSLYGDLNNPELMPSRDPEVARLRQMHRNLDLAVLSAYGWSDLEVAHGFYEYRGVVRWTIDPTTRVEILDRLLELNLLRASLEAESNGARRRRNHLQQSDQEETLFS